MNKRQKFKNTNMISFTPIVESSPMEGTKSFGQAHRFCADDLRWTGKTLLYGSVLSLHTPDLISQHKPHFS